MKIILLDTNVVLDYLLLRSNYEDVVKIINLAINNEEYECVTSTAITDIGYIVAREKDDNNTRKFTSADIKRMIKDILQFIDVLPTTDSDINFALDLDWNDFEDAVQYSVAKTNGVDCIVTNNIKDFKKSEIEVLTPKEFLRKYCD